MTQQALNTPIIGLTGGIGSGKTAVSDYFAQLGITIVDADIASRTVVTPPSKALNTIAEHFGSKILLTDGELNRAALRQVIFSTPSEKQWLEALLHPLITAEIDRQLEAISSPYGILVSPLLLEGQQHERCDRILVIDVPEELQISRACQRDSNSIEQVKRIIASQISRQERCDKADDIVDNSQGLEELHQQIDQLHQYYLRLAIDAKSL